MKNRLWTVLLATLALAACATPGSSLVSGSVPDERTIFVTRHMHKAAGDDPALSDEGAAAAERLAELLAGRGVTAIFATPTRRAMQTAAPLAHRIGVAVTAYDPADPRALAASVATAQGAVLVVGHSNTVHDLVEHLGGPTTTPLTDQDYGAVFTIDDQGNMEIVRID